MDINDITKELQNETNLIIANFKAEAYDNVAYSDRIVTHKINDDDATVIIVFVHQGNAQEMPQKEERYTIVKIFLHLYTLTHGTPPVWKSETIADSLECEEAMHYILNNL